MRGKWILLLLLAFAVGGSKAETKEMAFQSPEMTEKEVCFGRLEPGMLEEMRPIPGNNLLIARKNGLWGILNIQGEVMVPFLFDQIRYEGEAADQVLTVSWLGKEGCLNLLDFSELVPIMYDSISDFVNGQAVVQKDGKYGVINKDGHLDVPVDREQIPLLGEEGATLLAVP